MTTNKKGRKIHISNVIKSSLHNQIQQHGGVTEVRKYKNAQLGAFFEDGQFRFFRQNPTKKRSPTKKSLSSRRRSPTRKRSSSKKGVGAKRSPSKKRSPTRKGSTQAHAESSKKLNTNMVGGRGSGDLKTSVNLLREYYLTRY